QTGQITSHKLLADRAGHTFLLAGETPALLPLHDRASHRLRDIGAHARRAPVILVRAGETKGVIAEAAAIDHAVLCRRELARVVPVMRPVLAQALRTEIDCHAERQDTVDTAEINRDV